MADEALHPLGACLQARECASGELVCVLGEPGETMYFIVSGEVKISLPGPNGGQIVVATLGASNFFGELALIDGQPRSANATSTGPSHLLVLSRDDFLDFLGQHRQALQNLLLGLSRRLREANHLLQELAAASRAEALPADEQTVMTDYPVPATLMA
jgi:CRP-like cAMP-binding protein